MYFDNNGNKISGGNFIIKPEGFTISSYAIRIHGISTEKEVRKGHSISSLLKEFDSLMGKENYLLKYNKSFDEKIVGYALLRKDMQNNKPYKGKICSIERITNFSAINGSYGYKWPKLSEFYYQLFRTGFEEAHNAAVDITAALKYF